MARGYREGPYGFHRNSPSAIDTREAALRGGPPRDYSTPPGEYPSRARWLEDAKNPIDPSRFGPEGERLPYNYSEAGFGPEGEALPPMSGSGVGGGNFLSGLLKYLKGGMFQGGDWGNASQMGGMFGKLGSQMPERKINVPQVENDMYGGDEGGWYGGSSGSSIYDERIPNPDDYSGGSGGGGY